MWTEIDLAQTNFRTAPAETRVLWCIQARLTVDTKKQNAMSCQDGTSLNSCGAHARSISNNACRVHSHFTPFPNPLTHDTHEVDTELQVDNDSSTVRLLCFYSAFPANSRDVRRNVVVRCDDSQRDERRLARYLSRAASQGWLEWMES